MADPAAQNGAAQDHLVNGNGTANHAAKADVVEVIKANKDVEAVADKVNGEDLPGGGEDKPKGKGADYVYSHGLTDAGRGLRRGL